MARASTSAWAETASHLTSASQLLYADFEHREEFWCRERRVLCLRHVWLPELVSEKQRNIYSEAVQPKSLIMRN